MMVVLRDLGTSYVQYSFFVQSICILSAVLRSGEDSIYLARQEKKARGSHAVALYSVFRIHKVYFQIALCYTIIRCNRLAL